MEDCFPSAGASRKVAPWNSKCGGSSVAPTMPNMAPRRTHGLATYIRMVKVCSSAWLGDVAWHRTQHENKAGEDVFLKEQ
jgi:hypothetical protein